MAEKYYRVVKDHHFWEKGAILKKASNSDNYEAVSNLWDKFDYADKDGDSYCEYGKVIEKSDWFEQVYPIGKLEKMVFGNKKQAQAAAAALYKGDE